MSEVENDFNEVEQTKLNTLTQAKLKRINEYHRFSLVVIGALACVCTSFGAAWNIISGYMQTLLGLNQVDLANINLVGSCFTYFVLPYAFLYDYFGPIPVSVLSIVLFSLGCLLFSFAFGGQIQGSVVRLCVFNAIMKTGCILFDQVGNVTVVTHFPTMRGPTIAMMKSFVGIGGAIVSAVQLGFFPTLDDIPNFYYLLIAYAVVFGGLELAFMRNPQYHLSGYEEKHLSTEVKEERKATKAQYLRQEPPLWRFLIGYGVLILLIIYLPTQSACVQYLGLGKGYQTAFAAITVVLMALIVLILIPDPRRFFGKKHRNEEAEEEEEEFNEANDNEPNHPEGEEVAEVVPENLMPQTEVDFIAPQYQSSFLRNLLTLRLWCIFWTLFCLTGAEFVMINYSTYLLGAISESHTPQSMRTMLNVINGSGSAVGRLGMALFEYITQHRPPEKRISMTWAPVCPMVLCIFALILLMSIPPSAAPLPYVLVALANGAQAAQTVLVPRIIYAKDPAKHYNFCFSACVLSSILLVRLLFAEWYNKKAEETGGTDGYCVGRVCVMMPLGVLLGLVCSTIFSILYVHLKYVWFCEKVFAERRQMRRMAEEEEDIKEKSLVLEGLSEVVMDDLCSKYGKKEV